MNASRSRPARFALFAVTALLFADVSFPFAAYASDRLASAAPSVIQGQFLDPLRKKEDERSRYSRAALPPQSRRVRILDENARTDGRGRRFVAFAVDESRGFGLVKDAPEDDWLKDAMVGCVYPESGEVLIKRGEAYLASAVLLGRPTPPPAAGVCQGR